MISFFFCSEERTRVLGVQMISPLCSSSNSSGRGGGISNSSRNAAAVLSCQELFDCLSDGSKVDVCVCVSECVCVCVCVCV